MAATSPHQDDDEDDRQDYCEDNADDAAEDVWANGQKRDDADHVYYTLPQVVRYHQRESTMALKQRLMEIYKSYASSTRS